jgi:hypothetical protein
MDYPSSQGTVLPAKLTGKQPIKVSPFTERGGSLWSSGQSSWLQILRSRVRFPALPDFPRSSGSGTGSTQSRVDNWGATWKESSGSGLKIEINGRGDSLRWPRDALYPLKLALISPTSGGRSVGIGRWRTEAPECFFMFLDIIILFLFKTQRFGDWIVSVFR